MGKWVKKEKWNFQKSKFEAWDRGMENAGYSKLENEELEDQKRGNGNIQNYAKPKIWKMGTENSGNREIQISISTFAIFSFNIFRYSIHSLIS